MFHLITTHKCNLRKLFIYPFQKWLFSPQIFFAFLFPCHADRSWFHIQRWRDNDKKDTRNAFLGKPNQKSFVAFVYFVDVMFILTESNRLSWRWMNKKVMWMRLLREWRCLALHILNTENPMIHHSIWLITCLVTCIQTHLSTFMDTSHARPRRRRRRQQWLICCIDQAAKRWRPYTHTHSHHYDIWILDFVSIFIDISMPSNVWRIKAEMLNFYLLAAWWPVHRAVCVCVWIDGMRVCFFFPFVSFPTFVRSFSYFVLWYVHIWCAIRSFRRNAAAAAAAACTIFLCLI